MKGALISLGLRFRKSINLGGGVRLNLSKSGVGVSAGRRGMRVGIGPGGLRTTVGIPGTGVYYEKRKKLGSSKKGKPAIGNTPTSPEGGQEISLSFFKALTLPPAEKDLIEGMNALLKGDMDATQKALKGALGRDRTLADASFVMALILDDDALRLWHIENVFKNINNFGKYFSKYNVTVGGSLQVTDELSVEILNDELGLTLLSAEIYQDTGNISKAIEILKNSKFKGERLVQLSLGELYFENHDFEGCIGTLTDMENIDEIGTVALLYTGLSFKEMGLYDAAVETLRKALRRKKNRSQEVLLTCRFELAEVLELKGDYKKAKTEYEKILAEAPQFRNAFERAKKL